MAAPVRRREGGLDPPAPPPPGAEPPLRGGPDGFPGGGGGPPRAPPAATRAFAFSVAFTRSFVTQETCSRMFTMWTRNGFAPALSTARRKVASWRCGEQEATTIRFSLTSWMSFAIISWPGLGHMDLYSRPTG